LVELRGTTISDSIDQLRKSLEAQQRGTSADDLCGAALQAQLTNKTRDDIAIVVVRVPPLNAPALAVTERQTTKGGQATP